MIGGAGSFILKPGLSDRVVEFEELGVMRVEAKSAATVAGPC